MNFFLNTPFPDHCLLVPFLDTGCGTSVDPMHTCDEFEMGIREIFPPFQGVFLKMYRIYSKILGSFQGGFEFFMKKVVF